MLNRPLQLRRSQDLERLNYEELYKYDCLECNFSMEDFLQINGIESTVDIFFEG